MIVGTAGHVDHGKTSLVRALTGVDTDRLAEEKRRGISIELGFAYTPLGDETAEPVGFIDVPGHRRFVQTMIAGAAGIDLGLLVIAADDGPMPQTHEHLAILAWLGVTDLVVALSKVDAVDAVRREAAVAEIHALLDGSPYDGATIVATSTATGDGLDALKRALQRHRTQGLPASDDARRFRLSIDRAFVLPGIGLVVTGTCSAGRVRVEDVVTLLPGGLVARVRGIHAQNRAVEVAHAGQRVALNLVGRGIDKGGVHRGDWLVAPAVAIVTDRVDVALSAGDVPDHRRWRNVRFHAGAMAVNARVVRLAEDRPALAQIVFDAPVHVLAGDRFVLRDASLQEEGSASIAGGVVLDVDVPARGRRGDARLAYLDTAATGDAVAALAHAVRDAGRGLDLDRWNVTHNTALAADAVAARVVGDSASGIALFDHPTWDAALARVIDVLAAEHARAPDAVGPGRDRLRRMSAPAMSAIAFAASIDALRQRGDVMQTGAWLHLASHRVELSDDDRACFERVQAVVAGAAERFNPPRVRELARELGHDEAALRGLSMRLALRGELYRIAHDHYFMPDTVRALAAIAVQVQADDGTVRAAPFRDRLGVGRKVAIHILEFFDRVGYTRRTGDAHRVIQPALFESG